MTNINFISESLPIINTTEIQTIVDNNCSNIDLIKILNKTLDYINELTLNKVEYLRKSNNTN